MLDFKGVLRCGYLFNGMTTGVFPGCPLLSHNLTGSPALVPTWITLRGRGAVPTVSAQVAVLAILKRWAPCPGSLLTRGARRDIDPGERVISKILQLASEESLEATRCSQTASHRALEMLLD